MRHLTARWDRLGPAGQFSIAALVVLSCGMGLFGSWVTERIERGVIQTTANGAALYITSIVAPHAQNLHKPGPERDAAFQALDALLTDTILGQKVVTIKIWAPDGTIIYGSNREIVGKKYPVTENLKKALSGEVIPELDILGDEGDEIEQQMAIPLLEIYTPIRDFSSGKVIAVVEIYEQAGPLQQSLREARLRSWSIICLVTLQMLAVLFVIIHQGSSTIAAQQKALRERIGDLFRLLAQNKELRDRVDDLLHRSVATNDLILRRVGSELHDGPAQLISLALLRLDALNPQPQVNVQRSDDYEKIRSALADSLTEIRNLSAGLALPELEALSPADALRIAIMGHERRTGTTVECHVGSLPPHLSNPLKACLYRVTQEGLNNAFRHAEGVGQAVQGVYEDGVVRLVVSDRGPGLQSGGAGLRKGGLGLQGMRDRVSSLGGIFEIQSSPKEGTRLTASFKVEDDGRPQG